MIALLVTFLIFAPTNAQAHDWMTGEQRGFCCNDKDCKAHPRTAVDHTAAGWLLKYNGQVFPDGDPRLYTNPRPDLGEVWICHMPWEQKARCLFVLPEGS